MKRKVRTGHRKGDASSSNRKAFLAWRRSTRFGAGEWRANQRDETERAGGEGLPRAVVVVVSKDLQLKAPVGSRCVVQEDRRDALANVSLPDVRS